MPIKTLQTVILEETNWLLFKEKCKIQIEKYQEKRKGGLKGQRRVRMLSAEFDRLSFTPNNQLPPLESNTQANKHQLSNIKRMLELVYALLNSSSKSLKNYFIDTLITPSIQNMSCWTTDVLQTALTPAAIKALVKPKPRTVFDEYFPCPIVSRENLLKILFENLYNEINLYIPEESYTCLQDRIKSDDIQAMIEPNVKVKRHALGEQYASGVQPSLFPTPTQDIIVGDVNEYLFGSRR